MTLLRLRRPVDCRSYGEQMRRRTRRHHGCGHWHVSLVVVAKARTKAVAWAVAGALDTPRTQSTHVTGERGSMRAAIGDRAGQFLACADSAIERERFEMFLTRRG